MSFDDYQYDRIRAGAVSSAGVLVPLLVEAFRPRSVIDLGCGEGWFAKKFEEFGIAATGVDLERPAICPLPSASFVARDLTIPARQSPEGWFAADLVICLEVAEHLPPERGESFVGDLVTAAPVIVFSAAIPGQGGHMHINERWQSYWADLFAGYDYWPDVGIRDRVWNDPAVEPWYRQNLIVYSEGGGGLAAGEPLLDVVHPAIFGWYVEAARV